MRLDEVIRGIAITDRRGYFDVDITGLSTDSRRVETGNLFIAVRGVEADGHEYIPTALERGATSVMAEHWPDGVDGDGRPNVVLVPNARRAVALAAANFYGQPSRRLLLAGVTGTNGKTTVTYVLEAIMRAASKKVGVMGTVECRWPGHSETLDHTTPDAVRLQSKLAEMSAAGVTHVCLEVSSHALDQQRVAGVHFKVAGFTNLSQDHLDYHKSIETYFEAKARLFSECLRKSKARGRMAVVNIDDERGGQLLERWGGKSLSVSLDPKSDADVVALEAKYTLSGIEATVRTPKGVWEIESSLVGEHNLSNVLVGVGMALAMGFSKARITRGLRALERVPGRLERVPNDSGKHVFVDYAHTPDALEKAVAAIRPLTKGRLLIVFGCGGDRDKEKRVPMAKAVAAGANIAIVTNDNPRTEDPKEIANAIEKGLTEAGWKAMTAAPADKTFMIELDRRTAIRNAIDWMNEDDALIVAGKGHEPYQIIGKTKHRFDDREEARRILAGEPPPPPLVFDEGTSEVEVAQVEDSMEIVEGAEIIEEVSAVPASGNVTQLVSADNIVDAVDIEPEIVEVVDDDEIEELTEEADGGPPKDEKP